MGKNENEFFSACDLAWRWTKWWADEVTTLVVYLKNSSFFDLFIEVDINHFRSIKQKG